MKGYLGDPVKTSEVIRDGWYMSGDYARIDEEGFIHITGRQSRFSKIGGEMVPHIRSRKNSTRPRRRHPLKTPRSRLRSARCQTHRAASA